MNRRSALQRLAALSTLALPTASSALATPAPAGASESRRSVKITAIKAMQLARLSGYSLIKIETDAGYVGYGEAGASGPMARARIATMSELLLGQDPLAIARHFHVLSSLLHNYVAHLPTISGIDLALWDLAGKILNRPVFELLGGPIRDTLPLYTHARGFDPLDPGACRDWAARVRADARGFRVFKLGVAEVLGVPIAHPAPTLEAPALHRWARACENIRSVAGDDIEFAVHCHGQFDLPSAIGLARASEPFAPSFIEDPLPFPYSDAWQTLRQATRVPILTGEKLEGVAGFRPFLDRGVADYIHLDLAFAGGITGARKIADYAALTQTPVAFHNVGSAVLTLAGAHLGAALPHFYRSESAIGFPDGRVESLLASPLPEVRAAGLALPRGPGLGVEFNAAALRARLLPGEPFWD